MIELKNINIKFDKRECLRNGDFIAYSSQITSIIGESGTGKSSLLYLIAMLSHQQCEYYYHHQLLHYNNQQRENFRNQHISFITQNSLLIETISVEKNIEFYLKQSQTAYTVNDLLDMVNMVNKKNCMPMHLSGGERQRIAIACAIAKDSDIILGDEITSALDKENKDMIMQLLRNCARLGKIVILVSHENNIFAKSDRVYRLDHLELKLEKDTHIGDTFIDFKDKSQRKIKAIELFELLFCSNKKNNRTRLFISLVVLLIIFLGTTTFVRNYETMNRDCYSNEDVANHKILILNNENKNYTQDEYGYAIRFIQQEQPLPKNIDEQLKKIKHMSKYYDYYTLSYSMLSRKGPYNKMDVKVIRNNKIIEKRQKSVTDYGLINPQDHFNIIPFFKEEKTMKQDDGVYVNTNMAYYFNIEVGDKLDLKINVPFAMAKAEQLSTLNEREDYYPVNCLGEQMNYKAKVLGIIEGNSEYNDVYMRNDVMETMINQQVTKYQNNEIKVNQQAFAGYSTIIDLKPYAKVLFVDKVENVLSVQNEINALSSDIYAYNEHQSVIKLQEENNKMIKQTLIITGIVLTIIIVGSLIIECFYIMKYKSTYMMMRLIGFDKGKLNKIISIQALWQILIMLCISMLIYISATIPIIIATIKNTHVLFLYDSFPDIFLDYMAFGAFSIMHLVLLTCFVFFVIILAHFFMKKYYDRQDLIAWIRGK